MSASSPDQSQIENWLVHRLREHLEPGVSIDVLRPFAELGLESRGAISLTGELEDWLGVELDPILFYDFPTLRSLSEHLSSELVGRPSNDEPTSAGDFGRVRN